jgi:SPP1 gp7 family putative phage head morphogenesis protein
MRLLPAIRDKASDYDHIEAAILKLFRDELYAPLLREIAVSEKLLNNANESLFDSIVKGKVTFEKGKFHTFSGNFSSTLTKELRSIGAEWDRGARTFAIPHSKLPKEIQHAISISQHRFNRLMDRINSLIKTLDAQRIADKFQGAELFGITLERLNRKISGMIVAPELTASELERISKEYSKNMQLYIKDWTQGEIQELRGNIQKLVTRGGRYEGVVKEIQNRYHVGRNKAKFLARNESSLMMTKFKQVRYQSAGITEYVWECVIGSPNHPVRHFHKLNNGKTFRYDTGAIINSKGDKRNPGQDYNCRCIDRPKVRF